MFKSKFPSIIKQIRSSQQPWKKSMKESKLEDILDEEKIVRKKIRAFYSSFFSKTFPHIIPLKDNEKMENPFYDCVTEKSFKQLTESAEYYVKEEIGTPDELLKEPLCLLLNKLTLQNRTAVYRELGFNTPFKIVHYNRFVSIMNKQLQYIKAYGYINDGVDVTERLKKYSDVELPKIEFNDLNSLQEIRQNVITEYLRIRLSMTETEIEKTWKTYNRLKHKSFNTIVQNIAILHTMVGMPYPKIVNNSFLLHAETQNILDIVKTIPRIGDMPITELITKRPKLVMQSAESIRNIIKLIKESGIDENSILKNLEVLTLGLDTVSYRVGHLNEVEEFGVLRSHPRVMKLINNQTKARTRLEYLKKINLKCASLNILSSSSEKFERYARDGNDRSNGKDVVIYLQSVFKKPANEIRDHLYRAPNWCHVAAITVKQTMDFLRLHRFTNEEIYNNIVICLYNKARIEPKLTALLNWRNENIGENEAETVSNSQLLALCMYFIEADFHFTGNGIWDPSKSELADLKTTTAELPQDLIKDYRYGKKPSLISIDF